jgi:hypothetical protein
MPQSLKVYGVFIASPSDASAEREAAANVVERWNRENWLERRVLLRPLRWELDATPRLDGPAQRVIERQLLSVADVLIAFFRARTGQPTLSYSSGTIEEIETFRKEGKPILLYFFDHPPRERDTSFKRFRAAISAESAFRREQEIELYQNLAQLQPIRRDYERLGLVASYRILSELERMLQIHLGQTMNRLLSEE